MNIGHFKKKIKSVSDEKTFTISEDIQNEFLRRWKAYLKEELYGSFVEI